MTSDFSHARTNSIVTLCLIGGYIVGQAMGTLNRNVERVYHKDFTNDGNPDILVLDRKNRWQLFEYVNGDYEILKNDGTRTKIKQDIELFVEGLK